MNKLYERINYLTEKRILSSTSIYEYDIRQANINMLFSYGKISAEEYRQLQNLPKRNREIIIGKKQQLEIIQHGKSEINEIIKNGILLAKEKLFKYNNLSDEQIVRIANDAVYVESFVPLRYTCFDINNNGIPIEFVCKNHFSSFIKFSNGVTIYFSILPDDNFNIDVKGINDEILELHQNMLSFIAEMLFYKERTDIGTVCRKFNEFYNQYISRQLPLDYYREFCASSSFAFLRNRKYTSSLRIQPSILDQNFDKSLIDISYNLNILRELYSNLCA